MNVAEHRVVTIDCLYMHPAFAASYLRIAGTGADAEAAFIDTGTATSVARLLEALQREGLDRSQVRWIIPTHAHLDHAAGAGILAAELPGAMVLAHPKAARHLIDPTRLEASARAVYGDGPFEMLYGKSLSPIPAARVRAVEDLEEVDLGGAKLRFLHTRGHASHHICIHDPALATVFTGDSFGLRYPSLQKGKLFVFPSTSPTDFDGPEALATLERVVSCGIQSYFPTHFGEVREVVEAAVQLKSDLEFSMGLLDEAIRWGDDVDLEKSCRERIQEYYERRVENEELRFDAADWALLNLDLKLNAAGVAHVARKCRIG